jgi:hypothetical protein
MRTLFVVVVLALAAVCGETLAATRNSRSFFARDE